MTLHPQLVNNFSKIIFTPKYVDSRALSSIVASQIYALFVVKSTSVPKFWGMGWGGSSQFWQCQDFESAYFANLSLSQSVSTNLKTLNYCLRYYQKVHEWCLFYTGSSSYLRQTCFSMSSLLVSVNVVTCNVSVFKILHVEWAVDASFCIVATFATKKK